MIKCQRTEGYARELREIARHIKETSEDLSRCGNAVLSLLSRIFTLLEANEMAVNKFKDAITFSASLLRLANEKINSYPYREVPLCWRRLYTDSTLLKSISQLLELNRSEDVLLEVIRDLDMALIVAGAPGQNRPELLFKIISIAQSLLPSNAASDDEPRPSKRLRISKNTTRLDPPYVARPIPILPFLPDFLLPSSDPSHQQPFIVKSAASEWTATEKWKDVEYLRSIGGGRGRVVPVEVGNDYTKEGWGQRIILWNEFLDSMFHQSGREEEEKEKETFYLAQHSLLTQFPSLSRDFPIPSLVYSEPPALDEYLDYTPPTNEEGWIMNAWLGKGGTVSQAHTDPYWNCYVQVVGSKWVWIAPPSVEPHMATFGGTSSSTVEHIDQEGQSTATDFMTNTSTIDVTQTLPFSSTTSSDTTPHYPPAFLQEVEPKAQQIVLEAGDILVMPPGWWHAMKSLETSFSISIWF